MKTAPLSNKHFVGLGIFIGKCPTIFTSSHTLIANISNRLFSSWKHLRFWFLDSIVIYNNDIVVRLLKSPRLFCDPSSKQMLSILIIIESKAIMYPNAVADILFCIGLHHVTSNYIVHIIRAFKDKPLFLSFHNLFLSRLPFVILNFE